MSQDVTPEELAQYATDAAPIERAQLEALCVDVIRKSQSAQLGEAVRDAALLYGRTVADSAFLLGYRLGHDEGRCAGLNWAHAQAQAQEEARP